VKGRTLLMIPGPVEFEPDVLQAMGAATTSHLAPAFVDAFGRALERMRDVWQCPSGQPLVVAGSGTLAMELAGANLVEPGDLALVISTGVFGDRFEDLLTRHGAKVTVLRAPVGGVVGAAEIEAELERERYKLVTVTHVDTSTGVRMDVSQLGEMGLRHGALTVVDGVCSVGGEELRQEEWKLDVVLTASQKAVGVPPGLALLMASPRALEAFHARRRPPGSYYADWSKWLPVMKAYESRATSYFGTPAVNLVAALDVSLGQIVAEGMVNRFVRHARLARAFQAGIDAIGLTHVPARAEHRAHTLTACYAPEGVDVPTFLREVQSAGVTIAGGLHPEIKARTFRVGHMGSVRATDILSTVAAIETGLQQVGHRFAVGAGVAAAHRVLSE